MTEANVKIDEKLVKSNVKMNRRGKYERHIPLPKTRCEFAAFKRDHHYARYRPSIDLP